MELLGREGRAFIDDSYTIPTVEIGALNGTIVPVRNAHVGPVNVSGVNIDNDPVRNSSSADDDFSI